MDTASAWQGRMLATRPDAPHVSSIHDRTHA